MLPGDVMPYASMMEFALSCGPTFTAGALMWLAAASNNGDVLVRHGAVPVLYKLVQEDVCGREQAHQNVTLLAGLQGLLRCSACMEPPVKGCPEDTTIQGRKENHSLLYSNKPVINPASLWFIQQPAACNCGGSIQMVLSQQRSHSVWSGVPRLCC